MIIHCANLRLELALKDAVKQFQPFREIDSRDRAAIGLGELYPPTFFKDWSKTLQILDIPLRDLK